jgi:hypothetical protein
MKGDGVSEEIDITKEQKEAAARQSKQDLRRAVLKAKATRRAEFNHAVAMKRIDFTLDVVEEEARQIALDLATKGELPEFTVIEDEDE